jgi:hypothetical protein
MFDVSSFPRDLFDDLLIRVLEQRARGATPVSPRLPASKAEFPKLLCLDLNKWVDLGRAHYGRPGGESFQDALASVRRAVDTGKLVVPITVENALEVTNRKDEGSRRRLAEFMVGLSQNHSILNSVVLEALELDRAVATVYCELAGAPPLRPRVLERGLGAAMMGGTPRVPADTPQLEEVVREVLLQPEIAIWILSQPTAAMELAEYRSDNKSIAAFLDGIRRAHTSPTVEQRMRDELANVFRQGSAAARLQESLRRRGIQEDAFYEWLWTRDRRLRFVEAVPGIDVLGTLMLHKDRNLDAAVHPNDGEDLFFLRVGVPYGNIVVTENSWSHLANATGLADKYGTIVVADAQRLPELLAKEGCA